MSSSFFAMPTATRFARPELPQRVVGRRQLPLAAVDQDEIGKRPALLEQLAIPPRARPRSSRRSRPTRRDSPAKCGTCDTRSSASCRLRTPPSRPRSRCPESSRCRSTRCVAEWPAAPASSAASRARRTATGPCRSASPDTRCARCARPDRRGRACRRASAPSPARGGPRGPRATPRAARASSGVARQMHLGGRRPIFVELLDRRLQNFRRRSRNAFVRRELHALEHFAARASRTRGRRRRPVPCGGRTRRDRPCATVAIFCWRSRSVCTVRAASRRCAASSNRSAAAASVIELVSRSISSSFFPSKNSCVCCTASSYCSFEQMRGDAWRDAALDVVLEARPLAVAGNHLVARSDAEQPVRQPHRPARERRRHERTGVIRCRRARRCARRARAETPRSSSAADTDSSCRRAAGRCSAARAP